MELVLYDLETVQIQRTLGMGGKTATFLSFLKGPPVAY